MAQNLQNTTGPDGTMAKSSPNGLVGTGFASWYWLQRRVFFLQAQWIDVRPLQTNNLLS